MNGALTLSTPKIFSVVPIRYFSNLFFELPVLSAVTNVIAALSAGLDARLGLILNVAPPEVTVASAKTV